MADVDLVRPAPRHTTSATDFASVGLWAAAQRAELQQLTKELRALQVGAGPAAAPTPLAGPDAPAPASPDDAVDVLLETRIERIVAGAGAARDEAAAVVATAVCDATRLLESIGADEATIRRLTATRSNALPALPTPPDAAAIRRAVQERTGLASASAPPQVAVSVATPRDAMHAYDTFWRDVPTDRPIRERLRRFGQRSHA